MFHSPPRSVQTEMSPTSGAATPDSYPQSPLRITHDGEFYARLLTRESSAANPSFRYYGAGPAAVPFGWESHPGTPKDTSCCRIPPDTAVATIDVVVVPAITPPPSYHLRGAAVASRGCRPARKSKGGAADGGRSKYCGSSYKKLKWIKIGFIAAVFRRLSLGKPRVSSASSPAASTVHSSSSSARWLFAAGSSSVDEESAAGAGDLYYDSPPAPKGMLCLGIQPSPWMVRFCGGRREADWVHGWP